ncbi:MAG: hypothetical protein PF795_06355 [Kiritimatiellae bacterium]|nr:hypothetical protein [Kiritimatiellia bacterium]
MNSQPPENESFWTPRLEGIVLYATAGVACIWVLTLCLLPPDRWVDYLSDDAYYYLKVARHLSRGHGPTFDGITVTTGFHPLFAFILAGFQNILPQNTTALPRALLLFNSVGCLFTGIFIRSALKQLWGSRTATWGAIFWYANPNALLLISTGMEGSLYACLLAAYFAVFSRVVSSPGSPIGMGGLLALAALNGLAIVTRTDALVLAVLGAGAICAPFVLPRWFDTDQDSAQQVRTAGKVLGKAVLYLFVTLIPFSLWLRYAEQHTGTWLQASAQMKEIWRAEATEGLSLWGHIGFSLDIFQKWVVKSIVKVPALKFLLPFSAAFFCVVRFKPLRFRFGLFQILWIFPLLLGAAYSLKFTKAWTWYYAPGLVGLTLVAAGCLHQARMHSGTGKLETYAKRWIPALLVFTLVESYVYLGLKSIRGRNKSQRDMVEIATWMHTHIPEEAWVGAWNSGIYGWVGERTVINLDGLVNNEIHAWTLTGKSESEYIRNRNLDYIVDRDIYMDRSLPDWEEGTDYTLVYRHPSPTGSEPIEIWKVLR